MKVTFSKQNYGTFRIPLGDDPEDTKKWLEERRRKFPTRKNVQEKIERERKMREEEESSAMGTDIWRSTGGGRKSNENGKTTMTTTAPAVTAAEAEAAAAAGSGSGIGESRSSAPKSGSSTKSSRLCKWFMSGRGCSKGSSCSFVHDSGAKRLSDDARREKSEARDSNDRVMLELYGKVHRDNAWKGGVCGPGGGQGNGKRRRTNGGNILSKLLEGEKKAEVEVTLAAIRYLVEVDFYQSGLRKEGIKRREEEGKV